MGAFKSAVITKKGQELLAKVVAGTTKLEFTKIKVSDTKLSGDLASMTGIGTIKQEEKVASVVRKNGSNVTVSASFSNQTLGQGYYVRNLGLYANDPQAGEILYSISVADESTATADYMPPFNGIGVSSLMVDLVTAVSNASSVKVNVDPTAGATVAQIVNLQEQIDDVKSFVGYESSDVYGVEVDFVNKKFTRLAGAENLTSGADFDKLTPWGGRKRCNLTNEGVMVAYRGETGYSEAGATSATITKGTTEYPSGTKVQTMVEQPLFYTKVVPVKSSVSSSGRGKKYDKARFYISPTPKAGFKPVDGFLDDNGILQDKIYLSAFEGSIFDTSAGAYLKADEQVADFATDMLSSIAGAKPASGLAQNLTRANVRKLCTNRGKGWKSHNIFALTATQWLILVEYASMNAQSVIGQGVSTFTGVLQQVVSSLLCTYKIMIRWVPKHMKDTGDLFSKICDMDNLRKAHKNAKRGKGWYAEVKCIEKDLDHYLKRLQENLIEHRYHTSEYEIFTKKESNKEREIYKLPFYPDRICQWAILQVIEPYLLNSMTKDTYSAIPNRGIQPIINQLRGYKKKIKKDGKVVAEKWIPSILVSDPEATKYCLSREWRIL